MKFFVRRGMFLLGMFCSVHFFSYGEGLLRIYYGPMCAGKTTLLISDLKEYEQRDKNVLALKHYSDKRYDGWGTHDKQTRKADGVWDPDKMEPLDFDPAVEMGILNIDRLLAVADEYDVIGIDEIQLFSLKIFDVIKTWLKQGKVVICAGRDMDCSRQPIGQTLLKLLELALEPEYVVQVFSLTATCSKCMRRGRGEISAPYTQCLTNDGKMVSCNVLHSKKHYEPCCGDCFTDNKEE